GIVSSDPLLFSRSFAMKPPRLGVFNYQNLRFMVDTSAMIESIWAKNLLCFDAGEHRVECAPLTVLVGPNNSGKSAMITGFNLLIDAGLKWSVFWTTESYSLGDFASAVHKHDLQRAIEVGATMQEAGQTIEISTSIQGGNFSGLRWREPRSIPDPAAI